MKPKMRLWRSPRTGHGYVWKVALPGGGTYAFTGWSSAMAFVDREFPYV